MPPICSTVETSLCGTFWPRTSSSESLLPTPFRFPPTASTLADNAGADAGADAVADDDDEEEDEEEEEDTLFPQKDSKLSVPGPPVFDCLGRLLLVAPSLAGER